MKQSLHVLSMLFTNYTNEEIINYEQLPKTTSGNDAYIISTRNNTYVLRTIARPDTVDAHEEYSLQQALLKANISTPIYLKTTSGSLTAHHRGVTCTLSSLIKGERPQEISLELVRSMGKMLAHIQNALINQHVTQRHSQWFDPRNIQREFIRYDGQHRKQITKLLIQSSDILEMRLPRAIIHGDLHTHNIFAVNDGVSVVFDLETTAYTVRILDIARTYLTLVKGTEFQPADIMSALIDGYDATATMPLTPNEMKMFKKAISYVATTTAIYIHNNGNLSSSERYLELAVEYSS